MKNVYLILILVGLLCGCAGLKQATSDYQVGATTPLANGEVSPQQQAAVISGTVSSLPIPFAGPIAAAVGFLGTLFFTWQRGVSIRKAGGAPKSTAATQSIATNGIIQDIANIFAGMFTTASTTAPTTTGTVFQRIWKTALATVAAGVATATTIPSLGTYLTGHPVEDAVFVGLTSLISGAEKLVSNVPVTA